PVEGLKESKYPYVGVKEAVFPFNMFPEVDPVLGPEMRSTGEVLGLSHSFGLAFYKAEEAAGCLLPTNGTVLMTVSENDRKGSTFKTVAQGFARLGFKILATEGTYKALNELGVESQMVHKINEGRPNLVDAMKNGEVQLVVNTPLGKRGQTDDSYIRKNAIRLRIPYMTTLAAAFAALKGIEAIRGGLESVCSLQEYHR
ncbi:MAG: carbamoyl phosphate synthase large subunit, partial [Thermoguttaceae bacterium]|nr:carbamoyl phosphate synthase large subunit [Thermoguttaceae bacterium]